MYPPWHTLSLSSPHIPITARAAPSQLPNVCQTLHGPAWAGEPWLCQCCQASGGSRQDEGRQGGCREPRARQVWVPDIAWPHSLLGATAQRSPTCLQGGSGHSQGPSSVTPLPGQSAGDTGLSACHCFSCCSPGPFSSPVNFCVRLLAVQLRNVLPFALASAEVMFSAELSQALSGEGPRPEGPGDLAPPLWPGSSLLAPSWCQHSMSSSVWRGMGLDAALVQ